LAINEKVAGVIFPGRQGEIDFGGGFYSDVAISRLVHGTLQLLLVERAKSPSTAPLIFPIFIEKR
jgi:hypothetical protein